MWSVPAGGGGGWIDRNTSEMTESIKTPFISIFNKIEDLKKNIKIIYHSYKNKNQVGILEMNNARSEMSISLNGFHSRSDTWERKVQWTWSYGNRRYPKP